MWLAFSASPSAGRPPAPRGFGEVQGAGGVDHRPGEVTADRAAAVRHGEHERLRVAARAEDLVGPLAGDRLHDRARLDHGCDLGRLGEGLEIGLVEVGPGWHPVARRLVPTLRLQQCAGGGVDIVRPGREQPHVAPVAHVLPDGRAGFVDLHRDASLNQVGGGRKADGSRSDDGNRKSFDPTHRPSHGSKIPRIRK